MDTEAKQGLLLAANEERSSSEIEQISWRYEKASLQRLYFRRFASLQAALLLLYTVALGLIFQHFPFPRTGSQFVYTPAAPVDAFEKTMLNMHLYKDNPYKGPPTPAVDAAWDKLFTNAYIRLSEDELKQLGRNSTLIPDGSGDYLGALDVYHQLHCVRFIFQYVHQDYYSLKKINVPAPDHINHCIDVLRQVVMCLSDTSISTLSFHESYPRTWPEFKFQHSCRNWEAVDSWAGQPGRAVDQSDPERLEEYLRNPNFVKHEYEFDGHGEEDLA